jgi:hypothetical protein
MIVTTNEAGRFSVRIQGYWYRDLPAEEALRLGATRKEVAVARARHEALALSLPRFDGKTFDGSSRKDAIDYLMRSLGFSRSDAITILEIETLAFRVQQATGLEI